MRLCLSLFGRQQITLLLLLLFFFFSDSFFLQFSLKPHHSTAKLLGSAVVFPVFPPQSCCLLSPLSGSWPGRDCRHDQLHLLLDSLIVCQLLPEHHLHPCHSLLIAWFSSHAFLDWVLKLNLYTFSVNKSSFVKSASCVQFYLTLTARTGQRMDPADSVRQTLTQQGALLGSHEWVHTSLFACQPGIQRTLELLKQHSGSL